LVLDVSEIESENFTMSVTTFDGDDTEDSNPTAIQIGLDYLVMACGGDSNVVKEWDISDIYNPTFKEEYPTYDLII